MEFATGMTDRRNDILCPPFLDLIREQIQILTCHIEKITLLGHLGLSAEIEASMAASRRVNGAALILEFLPLSSLAGVLENVLSLPDWKHDFFFETNKHIFDQIHAFLDSLGRVESVKIPEWLAIQGENTARLNEILRCLISNSSTRKSPECSDITPSDVGITDLSINTRLLEKSVLPDTPSVPDSPSVDTTLMSMFKAEVETYARSLENDLIEIESIQSPEKIESLMRAAHSLKGAARIIGFDEAVSLAHAMEDLLTDTKSHRINLSSLQIDALLHANDFFLRLASISTAEMFRWFRRQSESVVRLRESLAVSRKNGQDAVSVFPPSDFATPNMSAKRSLPSADSLIDTEYLFDEAGSCVVNYPGKLNREKITETVNRGNSQEPYVRVQAEKLSRLMGLAGECLVQAKSMKMFSQNLLRMKYAHRELGENLDDGLTLIRENLDFEKGLEILRNAGGFLEKARDLLDEHAERVEGYSRRLENLTEKLNNEMVGSRMRPFSEGLRGFPRMIREMSRTLGKKAELEVLGASTAVDRDILEKLESPLNHIIRNALDHGLEPPAERIAHGKPSVGKITIEAGHRAGMLHIEIWDDGRGVNPETIRQKVAEKGLTSQEIAAKLSISELLEFLFLPDFSTAAGITEVSGRGVGLDVVQKMIQEVQGSIRVETEPGKGTSFHLQLPLTLSVLRSLILEVGGELYAVPLSRIDFLHKVSRQDIQTLEDRQFFTFKGEHIGLVSASQIIRSSFPPAENRYSLPVMVISDNLNRYGLIVDRFIAQRDLVVHPLDFRLGKVANINAGAILEDGSPLLLLDVEDLVRSIDNLLTQGTLKKVGRNETTTAVRKKRILVVDDSVTVREVERRLLENRGYEVTVAVDGADGWNTLQLQEFAMVVSDVDMPRMTGIELVRKIKAHSVLKDIPVVIVSYKDRDDERVKGLEAGADDYLAKSSFHDDRLLETVLNLIGEP